jgi:hypothetical protein
VKTRPKLRLGKTCDSINSLQRFKILKRARRPRWSPWPRNRRGSKASQEVSQPVDDRDGTTVICAAVGGGTGQSSGHPGDQAPLAGYWPVDCEFTAGASSTIGLSGDASIDFLGELASVEVADAFEALSGDVTKEAPELCLAVRYLFVMAADDGALRLLFGTAGGGSNHRTPCISYSSNGVGWPRLALAAAAMGLPRLSIAVRQARAASARSPVSQRSTII